MQLNDAQLARLGQNPDSPAASDAEPPDFVFYTGCNVLKTPHIALLALDIMDALGMSYEVMGGPSHCCGVVQMRTGDVDTSGRFGENTMDKLAPARPARCWPGVRAASCSSTISTLPTVEKRAARSRSK